MPWAQAPFSPALRNVILESVAGCLHVLRGPFADGPYKAWLHLFANQHMHSSFASVFDSSTRTKLYSIGAMLGVRLCVCARMLVSSLLVFLIYICVPERWALIKYHNRTARIRLHVHGSLTLSNSKIDLLVSHCGP